MLRASSSLYRPMAGDARMADLGKTPVLVQLRVVDQHMATAEHVTKL
jgi:hypothetical protein